MKAVSADDVKDGVESPCSISSFCPSVWYSSQQTAVSSRCHIATLPAFSGISQSTPFASAHVTNRIKAPNGICLLTIEGHESLPIVT